MPNQRLLLCAATLVGLAGLFQPGPTVAADQLVAAFYCPANDIPFIGDLLTPIVSLLEDPKVRAELGLSAEQVRRMAAVEQEYNDGVRGLLLGDDERSRELTRAGASPEDLVQAVGKMAQDSHRKTNEILERGQTQRLQEIVLQHYGLLFVPKQELRRMLDLNREQERGIDEIRSRVFARINETAAPNQVAVAANRCTFATLAGPGISSLLEESELAAGRLLNPQQVRTIQKHEGKRFSP